MLIPYKKPTIYFLWLICYVILQFFINYPKFSRNIYCDLDDYMRVMRVEQLTDDLDWYNGRVERENAPYGLEMHWTRAHDLCILSLTAPLLPFMPKKEAIHIAASFSGTIFLLLIILLIYDIGSIFSHNVGMIAALTTFLSIGVTRYVAFLRPDMHSLLIFLFTFILKESLLYLKSPMRNSAIRLGVLFGLSIWASPELILGIALVISFLTVWSIITQDSRYTDGLCLTSLIQFIIVFLLIFGLERPIGDLRPEFDRISIVHLLLSAMQTGFFLSIKYFNKFSTNPAKKFAVYGIIAAILLASLQTAFPGFLLLSMGSTDEYIRSHFLAHINEMQPSVSNPCMACNVIILMIVSSMYFITNKVNRYWYFFLYFSSIYFIVAALVIRCMPYYEIITAIPNSYVIIGILRRIRSYLHGSQVIRIIRPFVIFSVQLLIYAAPVAYEQISHNAVHKTKPGKTNQLLIFKYLDTAYPTRQLICADFSYSPMVLFFTKHSVVSGPYHRNKSGLMDIERLMSSKTPEDEMLSIIRTRGISIILTHHSLRKSLPHFIVEVDLAKKIPTLKGPPGMHLYEVVNSGGECDEEGKVGDLGGRIEGEVAMRRT